MTASDSTSRFSDRVAEYVRFRPSYPDSMVETLVNEAGISPTSVVADIGSGTGSSSELFLRHGCQVYGVEPNREMREAAEARFREEPRFRSIDATAEATTLDDASIDLVVSGQAFHWFDVEGTRSEFTRILSPQGLVALFWNKRRTESTAFLRDYEKLLLEFSTDYEQVNHARVDAALLSTFFGGDHFLSRSFPYSQSFDFEGLRGRLLSSSYAPAAGHPQHVPMLRELERVFQTHSVDSCIQFDYDTELYCGSLVPT